jgi:hypothetical protein
MGCREFGENTFANWMEKEGVQDDPFDLVASLANTDGVAIADY